MTFRYSNIFSESLTSSIQKMNSDFIVSVRNMRSEQEVVSLDISRVCINKSYYNHIKKMIIILIV